MILKRDAQADLLARIGLFRGVDRRDLIRIAGLTTEVTVPAGRISCLEGQPGLEAFVIVEGSASVTIGGAQVASLGPGDFFGEMALLDGGPRVATVTTTSATTLLVLTRREFYAVLAEVPGVAGHMLTALGVRLRHVEEALHGSQNVAWLPCG